MTPYAPSKNNEDEADDKALGKATTEAGKALRAVFKELVKGG
jgi:hypothetical protein